jgi:hypothetical protein
MTMQEMCEAILASPYTPQAFKDYYRTPESVFNYSRTGELFMIWEWYERWVTEPAAKTAQDQ